MLNELQQKVNQLEGKLDKAARAAEQHRQLFDEHPLPSWLADPQTLQIWAVNARAVQTSGYPRTELLALRLPELFDLPDSTMTEASFCADPSAPASSLSSRFRRKDGTVQQVTLVFQASRYMNQAAVWLVMTTPSEHQTLDRYRTLFTEAPIMYVITESVDGEPIIADCNELFCQTLGYTRQQVLHQALTEFYMPASRFALHEGGGYQRALDGRFTSEERQLVTRDGRVIETLLRSVPETNAEGRAVGTRAMFIDITERKGAEEALRRERNLLETITRNMGAGLAIISRDYKTLWANQVLKDLFGQVEDQPCFVTYNGQAEICEGCGVRKVFEQGLDKVVHEQCGTDAAGREIWSQIIATPINDEQGRITSALELVIPITERKQAELALERRLAFEQLTAKIAARFVVPDDLNTAIDRSLAEIGRFSSKSRAYLFLFKEDGRKVDNTHEWCAQGVSAQIDNLKDMPVDQMPWLMPQIMGGDVVEIEDIAQLPPEAGTEQRILQDQDIQSLILVPVNAGEQMLGFVGFDDVEHTGPWRKEDIHLLQVVSGIMGMAILRERIGQALKESEAKYRELFAAEPDAIIIVDAGSKRIIDANSSASALYGYSHEELRGMEAVALSAEPDKSAQHIHEVAREATVAAPAAPVARLHRRKDGTTLPVEITFGVYTHRHRRMICAIVRDVTERLRAEQALAAEKERLAVTLRSIGDGVITTDTSGCILLVNRVAEALTGWPEAEAIGRPLSDIFYIVNESNHEQCDSPIGKVIETGQGAELAHQSILVSRNGKEYLVSDSAAPILNRRGETVGVVLVFRDVTDKRRTELELQKIQKLESVGVLAGGIAHDFNNFLTSIIGNISLAKIYALPGEKVFGRLDEMEKAALRAQELTQQLLTFSKGGDPVKKTTTLPDLIKHEATFATRGSKARCRFAMAEDLAPVDIDQAQIGQVINNLIFNADQAMPEGGEIHVLADNVALYSTNPLSLPPGTYVRVSVQDEGVGIAEAHLSKVFDPYFTTKHKGSGLGLTVAYSIVDKHGGRITVDSRLGVGTTFQIYLPASERAVQPNTPEETPLIKGAGKILVMDDEELIRNIAQLMLTKMGYEVALAEDGQEAIDLYQQALDAGDGFAAVILDLTVPGGMGGQETIEKLQALDPNVRALVSSGYSNDPVMANYGTYGFKGVIQKPYRIQELSAALQSITAGDTA